MHQKISDVTILTVIISTFLLVFLGGIIIYFLFIYQRKGHKHQEELLLLNETFNKTLLLSKFEIQEQTLDHIAKELHANISHLVSIININLSTFLQQSGPDQNENIVESKVLVKQLMSEIKSLSVSLNSEHIGKAGFEQMLKNELERLNKTGLYQVALYTEGERYNLQPDKEIILFRLCQEILNNVIKHADANKIEVKLDYRYTYLLITIADNGKGFDVDDVIKNGAERNSTGIANIHSRSHQIGGQVSIKSSNNSGTIIFVKIPI